MKKRFFSSLLMGALVTATLSTVTSCKDYDDDISNLQGQIDKLATVDQLEQKVTELKGLISTNSTSISNLQASIEKAQKAAEAAQSAADQKATLEEVKKLLADSDYATKKYVDDADAILDAAIKAVQTKDIKDLTDAVEKAQKAAEAAQATADKAKTEAEAAGSQESEAYKKAEDAAKKAEDATKALQDLKNSLGTGYSESKTVAQSIQAINTLLDADNTGLKALDARLISVETALKGAEEGSTLNISTKLGEIEASLKNIIGEYSTMVTAVELYGVNANTPGYDSKLNFIQTEENTNVFPKEKGITDKQFTFEKGKYYVGEDSLLVRVSPVDAELTKENISLLNSQGQEISDDVIEVTSVSRNKELFTTTRAAGVNTGLWVVKFKAKDVAEKFEEAAIHKDEYGIKRSILYAVAVKNTYNTTGKEEDAKDRRVTSEYGVSLYTDVAQHGYDFTVSNASVTRSINNIKNRYTYDEDYKFSWGNTRYEDIPELVWTNQSEPGTEAILEGTNKNAADRAGYIDKRDGEQVLPIEKGKEITIDFGNKDIKGFYVTLDTEFALQSAPSELNAWNSYTYTNVGYKQNGTTEVPAKLFEGSKGTIVVNDLGNVTGDVIGFRVYAVNYDGTLTDPDGRAFYVAVGNVAVDATIPTANAECTIENGQNLFATGYIAVNGAFDKDFDYASNWINKDADASGSYPTFTVQYFDKDHKEVSVMSNSEIAYVKLIMANPTDFIDDATYTQTITLYKQISNTTAEVGHITVSAKKDMSTIKAPSFAYRHGFEKLNNVAGHQYIQPVNDDYTCGSYNKGGHFDFRNMLIVNGNADWNGGDAFSSPNGAFKFIVANGTFNNGSKQEATAESSSAFWLNVTNSNDENLVDNKTSHAITGVYEYYNISKKLDAKTNTYVYNPYPVPSTTTDVNIVYCSWTDGFGVKTGTNDNWVKNKKNEVTWTTTLATATTLDLSQLEVNIPAKDYISWANPAFSGLKDLKALLDANYLTIVADKNYGEVYTSTLEAKYADAEKKKYAGQINPYFTASIVGNNIVLTQNNQSVLPSNVNKEYIHLTVKDCFGNEFDLALPFVIKK